MLKLKRRNDLFRKVCVFIFFSGNLARSDNYVSFSMLSLSNVGLLVAHFTLYMGLFVISFYSLAVHFQRLADISDMKH